MRLLLRQYSSLLHKKASILVAALWVLIILSTLGVALGSYILTQVKFSRSYLGKTVLYPLAKAACFDAFLERAQDSTPEYDTLKELSKERDASFNNNTGYIYYLEDESAKININLATKQMLEKLPGLDEDLAQDIVNSGRRPFRLKEELLLIEDITEDTFKKIKDYITVYGEGKVNINTAPGPVLYALGMDEDLINIIMEYRKEYIGADEKKGTDDDGVFTSVALILAELKKFESFLSLSQEQQILAAKDTLSVKSEYFNVKVTTKIKAKKQDRVSILIYTGKDRILSWVE